MTETSSLDRQLADLIWTMTTALRAGYGIRQVFEQLATEAPEPAAGACGQVVADLNKGLSLDQALTNWQQATPSIHLGNMVAAILKHQQTGGNLAAVLEPIGETILGEVGTDAAFFPVMVRLAREVGAPPPQRAQ